ncbi:hypothetical protein [Massilia antarctica]|uniref:hypothetical protein n=1 Tax=Massilia antarctica TaxID=2765360 RepID=UPI0006BB585E|nr:hypothetical protein [Massilia sp. H27-R4]MCY0910651.1 hypothetical protein [Massilia sp. H27-R4]
MPQQIKPALVRIVLSAAAFAAAIFYSARKELERDALSPTHHVRTAAPVKQNADGGGQHSTSVNLVNITRGPCPPLFGATVAVVNDDAKVQAGTQALIAKNFDVRTLKQLSQQGDVFAALVLFQKARPCSEAARHMDSMEFDAPNAGRLSARECTQLPARFLRNPINILIPAADAGATAAKLLISKNAPTVASIMTILKDTTPQEDADLRALAERHGLDAARSGSESAMALLAHSYLSGAFGRTDAAGAYAIVQAWAHSGSAENHDRAGYLQSQLSTTELENAKSLLHRCGAQNNSASSIMLSPFN